ncbi:zinc finger protein [Elysia marginata]|uniref:Zinc finger protein n=1 Tax=Elysia marginata TaxID=1093978 RepID=A0AAV4FPF2_9GAST|nr:zinc finger protein [Elysia marginata]
MDFHYEFLRVPFGMMNSGATLTRAVKKLLCGMDNVVDYIDDLLVHTETWEADVETLTEPFRRLREANFTVRPVKCFLGSSTIDFLGHRLGQGTSSLQGENVEKVRNAPRPKTKKEVRAFLGLVGYYKDLVPNFAAISAPLSDFVRKGQPNTVNWGDSQEKAYKSLKFAVTSKPVLQLPDIDKRFILRTDASGRELGTALMQESNGMLSPVAYASKKLTDRERKYSVIEREALAIVWDASGRGLGTALMQESNGMLSLVAYDSKKLTDRERKYSVMEREAFAIVWGVKKFSLYLYGTKFTLQTNHGPLQFLKAAKFESLRIKKWALALQAYNFSVQYIKGSKNIGADYLSRIE